MLGHNLVNCKKLFEDVPQMVQVEGVGPVGSGLRRIVVNLQEDTVHPCGNGRTSEDRDELRLAS